MKKFSIALVLAGSMAVSLSAFAAKGAPYQAPVQDKAYGAWYIGAGPNWNSQFNMDTNGIDVIYPSSLDFIFEDVYLTTEQSSSDIGFDVYVGYDLSKYWQVELGYTYVGDVNLRSTALSAEDPDLEGSFDTTVKQWNVHFVGMGKLPVGEYVNVFLKGGIAYFSSKQEYDLGEGGEALTGVFEQTTDSLALTYGAGAELHWDNWGLRGEYNVMWPANNVREDFYIADVISANLYYKFN